MTDYIRKFVIESNWIERIYREPTPQEIDELRRFMALEVITIEELQKFVAVYQPDAKLRDIYGLNVRIGNYYPPKGGPQIRDRLENFLNHDLTFSAHELHINYERLHPFTDCNGRSGRALWAWKMKDLKGGFLLNFYYQTLAG